MATKLAGSANSGWYSYAELKKGKIYKSLIKGMEEDSLEFIIKKRKKL